MIPTYNMTIQNRHALSFHILYPSVIGICHVKLVDVHPSNISLRLLLVEIFISLISAKNIMVNLLLHTSVLCGAHPFASYIRLLLGSIQVCKCY